VIINVSNSATLATAIAGAHDGDTIQLAAGEYTLDKVQNLTFATGLTITSADPAHQAIIDGIYLQNDSGLTFRNLEVKVDQVQQVATIVQGGGNITLDHLDIHGTAVGNGLGVRFLGAHNVTLSNSEVHNLSGGVVNASDDTVSILNNSIHDIQVDGVQTLGTSNITISGNHFTNFYPVAGDHSDAMQFVGSATAAHDITITNNVYTRGAGLADTQGIFMGNEGGTTYENVLISGNAILGGVWHGIMVSQVDHLNLTGNIVEGYVDQNSWILITLATNSSETNNLSTSFNNTASGNAGLVSKGNKTIKPAKVGDIAVLAGRPTQGKLGPRPTRDARSACGG